MDELMNELRHLGLSDKEAAVYLASLELGPAAVQDISHKSKINRATTYVMIESLAARGLLSTFVRGKKRFYAPESPERLLSILRVQQQELEEKRQEFEKALPLLFALYNTEGAKPQIRYLEGVEGLKTLRQNFEKLEGEFIQILSFDDAVVSRDLAHGRQSHINNLKNERVPHRILAVTDHPDPDKIPEVGVGEWRMIPYSEFPMHGEITVRSNHVFLFSYRSSILAVIIVSKEIADVVRSLFNLAWKGA
ncbi:TrmB family transcriptional regulator, partial [Candidatus Parcubacteria bacterium]|nr:TrmB family transcriptional regulator [Candidatus Parcubacteria bacterium]